MASLGKRLRYAREAKNLSQTEVSARTKISNKALSRYELDRTEPDSTSLKALADLYEVSMDWLFGRNEKESEFSLPESQMDKVIREAEEYFKVDLKDDPDVYSAVRELIQSLAKMKSK